MDDQIFDPDDRPISEAKTAEALKVKVKTLATWRSQGRGPKFAKLGRSIHYTARWIREYRESRTQTPETASVRRQRRALSKQSGMTA